MKTLRPVLCLLGVLVVAIIRLSAATANSPTYESRMVEGARLAAESSWARARDAYAAAREAAGTADARRWADLRREDASWRSETTRRTTVWLNGHNEALTALITAAETAPATRDDFWAAALESRADLQATLSRPAQWTDRQAIADYLGAKPPSDEAIARYIAFLQRSVRNSVPNPNQALNVPPAFVTALENGFRVATSPDDRASCALLAALVSTRVTADVAAARWSRALAAAPGTRWAPHIKAAEFAWRARTGYDLAAEPNSTADFRALLAELNTLRQPLDPKAGDDPLTARIRAELATLETNWTNPRLTLSASPVYVPGLPLRFGYGATGFDSIRFSIRLFTPAEWVARSSPDGPANNRPNGSPVQEWTLNTGPIENRTWQAGWIERPVLEPGFYLLVAEGTAPGRPVNRQESTFVVSTLSAAAFLDGNGAGSLFVFNPVTGAPVANARAAGWVGRERDLREWSAAGDAAGRIAILSVRLNATNSGTLAALVGGQPVWASYYDNSPQSLVVDTFLDRPLYRPGEDVRWKLIVREQSNGVIGLPAPGLRMTVRLNQDVLIDNRPVVLNEFGTATGTIALPANIRPGTAFLTFNNTANNRSNYNGNFFTVDNYVPPAVSAAVSLASEPDSLRPGREVIVKVAATYLSGGPVSGAAIEGTWSSSIRYPLPAGAAASSDAYVSWQRDLAAMRPATTDAAGNAEFRLTLPAFLPVSTNLTLNARIIPDGGQAVLANQTFAVTSAGAVLDIGDWNNLRLAAPGEKMTFTPRVLDGAGNPRPFTGIARLMERRWSEAWVAPDARVVSGPELAAARRDLGLAPAASLPAPWRRLEGNMISLPVDEMIVRADEDGRLSAGFTLPRAGIYQVQVFSGPDAVNPQNQPPYALSVVAADASTRTLAFEPTALQLVAPARLAAGEPLRLFAILPEGQSAALLSVQASTEVSRRIDLSGRAGLVVWNDVPAASTNVNVTLAELVGSNYRNSSEVSIPVENPANRLTVQVAPANATPRPGAESSLRLVVRDSADRPVRAEIAIGGTDEAVNRLSTRRAQVDPVFWTLRTPVFRRFASMTKASPQLFLPTDARPGARRNPMAPVLLAAGPGGGAAAARGGGGGGGGRGGGPQDNYAVESFDFGAGPNGTLFGGAQSSGGFQSNSVGTGGRLVLQDVPTQYSVINREFIDALGITDINEAASWAPGQSFDFSQGLGGANIVVRQHFASTMLWAPSIITDANGEVTVPLKYADNLTQWRFEAYVVGPNATTFGKASAFTRTSLPLQSRLQLPRFLVAGDTARPTALLVNRTGSDMSAQVALGVEGTVSATNPSRPPAMVSVPRQGETTVVFPVKANTAGKAKFTGIASAGTEGDAMLAQIPVLEDGLQQQTAATARLAVGAKSQAFKLPLPTKLDRDRTSVSVQLSPSYAAAILDALPYLVDYPYGCVEQTMNRFLPAVVVRKTLADLGFNASDVERRILGRESAADAAQRNRTAGLGQLDFVVQDGVSRLAQSMAPDGGFGWWPGAPGSDPWMTAYVMWGAVLARETGVKFPQVIESRLAQGMVRYTDGVLKLPVDLQAGTGNSWFGRSSAGSTALLVAAASRLVPNRTRADAELVDLFDRLHNGRDQLPAAGRACLLLAARTLATADQRAVLLRNLENGAVRSNGAGLGDTVHWGTSFNYFDPMEGAVEATSLNLLALLDLDPKHALVEPALNWLLLNRRSAHWDSTRSTAFAVLALARCIEVRKEAQPDTAAELRVNGKVAGRIAFNRDSLLKDPAPLVLDPAILRGGDNTLEVVRTAGNGPVYATALGSAWATGAAVKPLGNLMEVGRGLERLRPQPTLLGTALLVPQALADGGTVGAGEQVAARVRLTIPNALQYVKLEVPKPAGCEPLNALSGWDARLIRIEANAPAGSVKPLEGRAVYREEHDDRSVFFLDRIDAGTWEIRFTMRATTPGDYRVLPATVEAMYVPEVRANSDARRLRIEDAVKATP